MLFRNLFLTVLLLLNVIFGSTGQALKFEWVNAFEPKDITATCFTNDIAVDNRNNLITAGTFTETVDFDPSPSSKYLLRPKEFLIRDAFITKLTAGGSFIWADQLGGPGFDSIHRICIDSDDNIYVLGYFSDSINFYSARDTFVFHAAPFSSFLLKLNEDGGLIWFKQFDANCLANSMDLNKGGSLVITGKYKLTSDFDFSTSKTELTSVGSDDIFIANYDTSSSLKWVKSIGGSSREFAQNIKSDPDGNIVINGLFNGKVDFDPSLKTELINALDSDDVFIAKYDSDGGFVWIKQWRGALYNPNAGTLNIDSRGNIITTRLFINTIDLDPGPGSVNINSSDTALDSYLLKLDVNGLYLWYKHIASTSTFHISSVSLGINDNICFGGSLEKVAYFDAEKDTSKLESTWIIDGYYAITDADGKYLWKTLLGEGVDKLFATKDNSLYIRGDFSGTIDFDPSVGEFLFSSSSSFGYDAFCLKLNQTPLKIDNQAILNKLIVYPNPFTNQLYFSKPMNATVSNTSGVVLYEGKLINEVNLSHLPSGTYLLSTSEQNSEISNTQKIVKY